MLLSGKIVLVTGGGRGIGAAICRVLARHGASVAINYSRSREAAEGIAAGIGPQARCYQADVRNREEVNAMVEQIRSDFGGLDAVVNNAIGGKQNGPFAECEAEDYLNAFQFGCISVTNTVKAALPLFRERGGGRVVNIVTEQWNMANPEWSVYLSGKGAMVGLSRCLARELGPDNITVNMVAPGWMADEKVDLQSEASRNFAASVPMRRQGSAEEIGNARVFLLSDLASYITGAYLPVTGGLITQAGM